MADALGVPGLRVARAHRGEPVEQAGAHRADPRPGRGALRLLAVPHVRPAVCGTAPVRRALPVPARPIRGRDGQARRGRHHQRRAQSAAPERRGPHRAAAAGVTRCVRVGPPARVAEGTPAGAAARPLREQPAHRRDWGAAGAAGRACARSAVAGRVDPRRTAGGVGRRGLRDADLGEPAALLRDVYGIETSELIDFDRFSIPFEGSSTSSSATT